MMYPSRSIETGSVARSAGKKTPGGNMTNRGKLYLRNMSDTCSEHSQRVSDKIKKMKWTHTPKKVEKNSERSTFYQ